MYSVFGALNLGEVFGGDGTAVLYARGEARAGGLIGKCEAGFANEGADLVLGQVGSGKRRECVVQRCGFLAWAELAAIVEVHSVSQVLEA
jgi:hypothetical protein